MRFLTTIRRAAVTRVIAVLAIGLLACGCATAASSGTSSEAVDSAAARREQVDVGFVQGDLPVLSITVNEDGGPGMKQIDASPDHNVSGKGTMSLRVPEGFDAGYGTAQKSLENVKIASIRGRGSSTWELPKRPYKIKFEEKQDLFGLGANKHWVLLANYNDRTLARNRLTNQLSLGLGMPTTMCDVPVDLVINGRYQGSYVLCEHLRIGKSRVDIAELTPTDVTEPNVTGGYLLTGGMLRDEDDGDDVSWTTSRGVRFTFESPSFNPAGGDSDDYECAAQREYIQGYLQRTEDAIFGEGEASEGAGASYDDYLDAQSFADYWLVQQFARNTDAIKGSDSYVYKDREGKLTMGPLWDFDLAYNHCRRPVTHQGNAADEARRDGGGGASSADSGAWANAWDNSPTGLDDHNMPWFDKLRQDPAFFELLQRRWKVLDELIAKACAKDGLLDQYIAQMSTPWEYDNKLWGDMYAADGLALHDTYQESIEDLRTWLTKRREWFNAHIGEMNHAEITLTFVADGQQVGSITQRCGALRLTEVPEAPAKQGYDFDGWYIGNDMLYDIEMQANLLSDATVEARYRKL